MPHDADVAVVVRHVLDEPVDRVVGVAGLVDVFALLRRIVGADVDELPLGHVTAAHVLKDEDVARLVVERRLAEPGPVLVFAIRSHAVGRARHQHRVFLRLIFRDVDGGEELDAVAHRDLVFVLRVMSLRLGDLSRVDRRPLAEGDRLAQSSRPSRRAASAAAGRAKNSRIGVILGSQAGASRLWD